VVVYVLVLPDNANAFAPLRTHLYCRYEQFRTLPNLVLSAFDRLVSGSSRVTTLFLQGEEEKKGGELMLLRGTVDGSRFSTCNCSKRVVLIHYSL
jgi:hypothetical protein